MFGVACEQANPKLGLPGTASLSAWIVGQPPVLLRVGLPRRPVFVGTVCMRMIQVSRPPWFVFWKPPLIWLPA